MSFSTRPELRGTFGMVASTHWLASAAGMAVLEQGGNAFDAAVATGFTLQVVEPHLNGPGGDLPALVWPAGRERPLVLCAQDGYPAVAPIRDAIRKVEQLFTDDWTPSVEVFLPAPEPGTLHRQRALAETYRRILAEAEAASTDRDAQLEAAR